MDIVELRVGRGVAAKLSADRCQRCGRSRRQWPIGQRSAGATTRECRQVPIPIGGRFMPATSARGRRARPSSTSVSPTSVHHTLNPHLATPRPTIQDSHTPHSESRTPSQPGWQALSRPGHELRTSSSDANCVENRCAVRRMPRALRNLPTALRPESVRSAKSIGGANSTIVLDIRCYRQ